MDFQWNGSKNPIFLPYLPAIKLSLGNYVAYSPTYGDALPHGTTAGLWLFVYGFEISVLYQFRVILQPFLA